jgi:hypothetical protein
MRRFLALTFAIAATAMLTAAEPTDAIREAGNGWRQGAIKQDKALLEKYLSETSSTRTAADKSRPRPST